MPIPPEQIKKCKICKVAIPLSQKYCREHQEMIDEREKEKNENKI